MGLSLRAPGGKFDVEEAKRALLVLCDPTLAHELRGLPTGASVILPGDQVEALAKKAEELSRTNNSVYLCLNPVALDCKPEKAVKDVHVEKRIWLMVDVDPVKPEEHKDDPASDEEKAKVAALAGEVKDYLTELGWPAPVGIDSGNGAYLLYRVDLSNDPECREKNRELCKDFLWRLSARFSGPNGKIDRATHNAARIAKVPGALSKKIGATESKERPFRISRLISVPNVLACVTAEQIGSALQEATETVTEDVSFAFGANASPETNGTPRKSKLKGKAPGRTSGYGRAALDSAVVRILAATPGGTGGTGRNDTVFRETAAIAELVAGGEIDAAEAIAALEAAAASAGLDAGEIPSTIQSAVEAGSKNPRKAPDRPKNAEAKEEASQPGKWHVTLDGETLLDGDPLELPGVQEFGESIRHAEMLTLSAMLGIDFPEPHWAVPGILSEGLNILAGAPKKGKSIMSLNLALTLAGGGKAMGNIKVLPSDVLYLSLEDKHRRIKGRAIKMLSKLSPDLADNVGRRLTIVTSWPRLDQGAIPAIDLWRKKAETPGLVIIDTWARFSPAGQSSKSAYAQDSDAMALVQQYVNVHGITALVVHHTRKSGIHKEPDDYVQEVSGTFGLSGIADGVLVLIRASEEHRATLHVTGRDVEEQEYVLEFDPASLVWSSLGLKSKHIEGRVQQKVVDFLRPLGRAEFCKDIAAAIGESENSVRQALNRLRQQNIIRKSGNAWAFPGEAEEVSF